MTREQWAALAAALAAQAGLRLDPASATAVAGGSINSSWRARSDRGFVFVKLNHPGREAMFAAEARGLALLAGAGSLRVPAPLGWGTAGGRAFLALEWLELRRGGAAAARRLGAGLAAQHRRLGPRFGLDHDNTIGSTEQPNGEMDDWRGFLRERRLGFQLELAARHGLGRRLISRGERLLERLPVFFEDYQPLASLLHGDLWAGNWAAGPEGNPVVFDPAVYYGDRESDLAMTELFGGFPAEFYAAYDEVWPRHAGYGQRRELYQLYHVLNHANLFGGSYTGQAQRIIDRLIAATEESGR